MSGADAALPEPPRAVAEACDATPGRIAPARE